MQIIIPLLAFISVLETTKCCIPLRYNLGDLLSRVDWNWNSYLQKIRNTRAFPISVDDDGESCNGRSTNNGEIGICTTTSICQELQGSVIGRCGYQDRAVCCHHKIQCSSSRNNGVIVVDAKRNNLSHLIEDSKKEAEVCVYKIERGMNGKGVVQLRLDFIHFEIEDGENARILGDCTEDTLHIYGAAHPHSISAEPLCGNLTGQHMYLNFDGNKPIQIEIFRKEIKEQKWDILLTFIKFNSNDKAPLGCLQYFRESRGVLKSFNYNNLHQLNNQEYSICIRTNPGMNRITYKGCGSPKGFDFRMTGLQPYIPSNITLPVEGHTFSGDACSTDWFMILGDTKYCGNVFPPSIITTTHPFMIQVRFDNKEKLEEMICLPVFPPSPACSSDVENSGFCIEYFQSVA